MFLTQFTKTGILSFIRIDLVRKPLAQLIRATSTTATTSSAVASAAPAEVGFQRPVRALGPAPVRLGFIPEEW